MLIIQYRNLKRVIYLHEDMECSIYRFPFQVSIQGVLSQLFFSLSKDYLNEVGEACNWIAWMFVQHQYQRKVLEYRL